MDPKNNKNQDSGKETPQKVDISQVKRDILKVEVRDPDRVFFSGEAVAVSSKNSVGPFDILPQHENFISLLTDKIIIYQNKHEKREIPNTSAIVKAKLNKVNIFLGIAGMIGKQQLSGQPASGQPKINPNQSKTDQPAKLKLNP